MAIIEKQRRQPVLFPVHDLVGTHGRKEVLERAHLASLDRPARQSPDLLDAVAGRSGPRIVAAADAALMRVAEGGSEPGYSYSAW